MPEEQHGAGDSGSGPTAAGGGGPAKVGVFAGGIEMPFTSRLSIVDPAKFPVRPCPGTMVVEGHIYRARAAKVWCQ